MQKGILQYKLRGTDGNSKPYEEITQKRLTIYEGMNVSYYCIFATPLFICYII